MISVQINSKSVDIREDLNITINWLNPMFIGINEGSTYSFSLPASPKNKTIIQQDASISLFFNGILIDKGTIKSFRNTNAGFEINMLTEGLAFRQTMESKPLTDFDFGVIEICEETDAPSTKLSKWKTHMTATAASSTSGTHKFPPMYCGGYTESSTSENSMFNFLENRINAYYMGEYRMNYDVPLTFLEGKQFAFTIAPTPRIAHLLNVVLNSFSYRFSNDLESILEYKQLICFNNYVLDKIEYVSSKQWNTHGTAIDLRNHVPNASTWELFDFLIEFFDAYFVLVGNEFKVKYFAKEINQPYVDFSKFVNDGYENETAEQVNPFELSYDIESFGQPPYLVLRYKTDDFGFDFSFPFRPIQYPTVVPNLEERKLKHLPFPCFFAPIFGTSIDWSTFFGDFSGSTPDYLRFAYKEYIPALQSLELVHSDEYPENGAEKFTNFRVGLYRGIYKTVKNSEYETSIDPTFRDYPFPYNFKELYFDQAIDPVPDPILFGTSSAYISESDNIFDLYKRQKLDFLRNSSIKKKQLNLPLHRLLELKKWENVNHFFSLKRDPFKGTIQEINFSISNRGISPAIISYYVRSAETASFNTDFNNDFNS